jgi:hypothetical protein
VPVAIAEVDRQLDSSSCELALERVDQRAVLCVDRAHAAEALVMVGDVEEPLTRDVAAAGDVLEERHHVVRPLRPAEGDDEQRVIPAATDLGIGTVGRMPASRSGRHRSQITELVSVAP